jgi:hypothetical protein
MQTDQLCIVSWRNRPRSFVSLMTLYESNFIRLSWLVRDLKSLPAQAVSRVSGDCDLHLTVTERSRYTTSLALTYRFDEGGVSIAEPNSSSGSITTRGCSKPAARSAAIAIAISRNSGRAARRGSMSAGCATRC